MSLPNDPDDSEDMGDRIAWRQIFVGYGMVLIILMLAILHQLGFSGNRDAMAGIGTAVVLAVVMAATALAGPAKALQCNVLADRPVLEDRLQWAAIVALVLLSISTIAHGILVLPASGWA